VISEDLKIRRVLVHALPHILSLSQRMPSLLRYKRGRTVCVDYSTEKRRRLDIHTENPWVYFRVCRCHPLPLSTRHLIFVPTHTPIFPLANGKIWCMGQPPGKVINRCTKFTMLIPSTKLLVYTPNEPLSLFFLLPLRMLSPYHSCGTLSSNCCIGSLSCTESSCTQSDSCPSSLWTRGSIYQCNL